MAMDPAVMQGIVSTAKSLGMDPVDLATIISFETGGSFNPSQAGPTTKWGQHRGLIQFGEPQARQYGVNWQDPVNSQLGPNGAVYKYFVDRGWKPGMGKLDAYSIVNAGAPGKYNAVDNGSTVADKVASFGPHRKKAAALLGMTDPADLSLEARDERPPPDPAQNSLEARDERAIPHVPRPPDLYADAAAANNANRPMTDAERRKGMFGAASDALANVATAMAPKPQQRSNLAPIATQMTPGMTLPMFDPQASDLQRQELAMKMARLNSGQLWG